MDQGPGEMMERYKTLSDSEKKRLEHDEDRLLSTMLYNLIAELVMLSVKKEEIRRKCRRLLGKSHIGLVYAQDVNLLLDQINNLVRFIFSLFNKSLSDDLISSLEWQRHWLKAASKSTTSSTQLHGASRRRYFWTSPIHGSPRRWLSFAIRERSHCWTMVVRTTSEWFDYFVVSDIQLNLFTLQVNMTYSPKTKVLCLWRRNNEQTQLHKYYTRKCKELYNCIKEAMERSGSNAGAAPELGWFKSAAALNR